MSRKLSGRKFLEQIANTIEMLRSLLAESFKRSQMLYLPQMAGSLAFTTVLSIVPLLAVLFYVFKLFGGFEYGYERLMPFLLSVLSEGAGEAVQEHLQTFINQVHAKAIGWVGIAGLVLTSITTYLTVLTSFNRIWDVEKKRSLQYRVARALTLLTVAPLLLSISIAISTMIASKTHAVPFSGPVLAMALNVLLFMMVYALVPTVKVPYKVIAFGSILPALLLEAAKLGYAFYTTRIVTYSAFYGSFAVIPLFLLWIYIAWYITLFGAVWVHTLHGYSRSSTKKGLIWLK